MTTKAETDVSTDAAVLLAKVVAFVALWIVAIVIDGWLLTTGWRWFLVPLGAPSFTFWQIVGVALMVRMAQRDSTIPRKDEKPTDYSALWIQQLVAKPLIGFGMMWFVRWMAA